MATLTPVKTLGTVMLALQNLTHPATVVGSAVDVSTKFGATIFLYHALVEAVANTNPGSFLVQVSPDASGNSNWITAFEFQGDVASPATEAMTATEPIG